MSSTEARLRTIISDSFDLDHDPDFDRAFSDAGVSSVDAVAFYKTVNQEFGPEHGRGGLPAVQHLARARDLYRCARRVTLPGATVSTAGRPPMRGGGRQFRHRPAAGIRPMVSPRPKPGAGRSPDPPP